jgi:hypothetical protein
MKKSKMIMLGTVFACGLASCSDNKWIKGYDDGAQPRDTSWDGNSYRYYDSYWYPIHSGLICPSYYNRGYSWDEISTPGFQPAMAEKGSSGSISGRVAEGVSTHGFGESAGGHGGEGGGGE